MENIQIFLSGCEAYGVPRSSLFQTVDLYEMRNMAQVLNCILQLGTEVRTYIVCIIPCIIAISYMAPFLSRDIPHEHYPRLFNQ